MSARSTVPAGHPWSCRPSPQRSAIRKYLDMLDGVILSGGDFDIHPRYYGERAGNSLGNIIPERTEFELALAEMALRRDMPMLGICGGAQAINVALGGSLIQDIKTQVHSAVEHQQSAKKYTGGHPVEVTVVRYSIASWVDVVWRSTPPITRRLKIPAKDWSSTRSRPTELSKASKVPATLSFSACNGIRRF